MSCYACARDAVHRCPRCGKPYCEEHGGEFCAACQNPASAIPSGGLYRGALLGLLVASVLALWLLIRPPGLPEESSGAQVGQPSVTPTPVATATASPAPSPSVAPTGTPEGTPGGTPGASPTPAATPQATPTPAPSPTTQPPQFTDYTVQPNDSLSSIAQRFGTTADELARINGIANPNTLDIGQKLKIPTPPQPSPTTAGPAAH